MRQNINIYQFEKDAGLATTISENTSIAFDCDIILNNKNVELAVSSLKAAIAYVDDKYKQEDLYDFSSVLVSAGWNKNDDVFSAEQLWAARHTPVHKPVNYMHDGTDIIGHMTGSLVMNQDGSIIPDDSVVDNLPDTFDIISSAVIYRLWPDQDLRERISELITEIDNGLWSVSMECIFSDFDYAIKSEDGASRALARTADSAFLTKHLRAYGGTGEYKNFKIGRILKGINFSGKGIVNKPANPRSVIFTKDVDPFSNATLTINNFLTATEVEMTQANTEQVGQLQKDLEAAKAEIESVKTNMLNEKQVADKAAADFNATIAEKDALIASMQAKVKELEDSVSAAKKCASEKEEEMNEMKKGVKNMKRKASLSSAGADEATAEDLMVKFQDASDEMFDSVVSLLSTKKTSTASSTETEVDVDSDALETAEETEASVVDAVNEDTESENKAIASAIDWLRTSVLKSTKNLKTK